MGKDILSELLQQCLAAYDAGLSPEECLSAFPSQRAELEPLFRQALSVRIAYAHAPGEEFKEKTREKLMFAAGRDVSRVLAAQPDERFVRAARNRFIRAAGAPAQEALRDVPAPRLPFWWNTRRKLLEAATLPRPKPAPRPFAAPAMRAGLSMAAVVMAVVIAGAAFLTNRGVTPSAASEIAQLERQLDTLEARARAGEPVSATEFVALSKRTTELVEKLPDLPSAPAAKLQALKERQDTVVERVYATAPPPEVALAQQQLDERIRALSVATATAVVSALAPSTPTSTAIPVEPTPSATVTPVSTPVLPPPTGNQARVTIQDGRAEIRTASIRFVAPRDWNIGGIDVDANGIPIVIGNQIGLTSGDGVVVFVYLSGQIEAIFGSNAVLLRSAGPAGQVISVDELVQHAGIHAVELRAILESFSMAGAPAAPVVPPPATNTPVPSVTPTTAPATSTPPPTRTPATATPSPTSTASPGPSPIATP